MRRREGRTGRIGHRVQTRAAPATAWEGGVGAGTTWGGGLRPTRQVASGRGGNMKATRQRRACVWRPASGPNVTGPWPAARRRHAGANKVWWAVHEAPLEKYLSPPHHERVRALNGCCSAARWAVTKRTQAAGHCAGRQNTSWRTGLGSARRCQLSRGKGHQGAAWPRGHAAAALRGSSAGRALGRKEHITLGRLGVWIRRRGHAHDVPRLGDGLDLGSGRPKQVLRRKGGRQAQLIEI